MFIATVIGRVHTEQVASSSQAHKDTGKDSLEMNGRVKKKKSGMGVETWRSLNQSPVKVGVGFGVPRANAAEPASKIWKDVHD